MTGSPADENGHVSEGLYVRLPRPWGFAKDCKRVLMETESA